MPKNYAQKTAEAKANRELFETVIRESAVSSSQARGLDYLFPLIEQNRTTDAVEEAAKRKDYAALRILKDYFPRCFPEVGWQAARRVGLLIKYLEGDESAEAKAVARDYHLEPEFLIPIRDPKPYPKPDPKPIPPVPRAKPKRAARRIEWVPETPIEKPPEPPAELPTPVEIPEKWRATAAEMQASIEQIERNMRAKSFGK